MRASTPMFQVDSWMFGYWQVTSESIALDCVYLLNTRCLNGMMKKSKVFVTKGIRQNYPKMA